MSPYCYFDITIGGKRQERVVFELYDDVTPKTAANFRALCDGVPAQGEQPALGYKGSTFHRVIQGFMIQGGDFTNHNGTGGRSIYGDRFDDENFERVADKPGLLAMANAGKNTNGSQFFVTCAPTPHLNGKHVVFGRVVRGMNTVRAVEHTPTGRDDVPVLKCVIEDCGSIDSLPEIAATDGDADPDYPEDATAPLCDDEKLAVAERVRLLGNKNFAAEGFEQAVLKYEKALRYLSAVVPTSANAATIEEKKVVCFSNSAQCFLKLRQWQDAFTAANNALGIDSKNTKALFRRGQGAAGMGNFDAAEADFRKILEAEPGNEGVQQHLAYVQQQQQAQKEKLARNLRKMFS